MTDLLLPCIGCGEPDCVHCRCERLRDALQLVLDTRDAEAEALRSVRVARDNYTDCRAEESAWEKAMIAASLAESEARYTLAEVSGSHSRTPTVTDVAIAQERPAASAETNAAPNSEPEGRR